MRILLLLACCVSAAYAADSNALNLVEEKSNDDDLFDLKMSEVDSDIYEQYEKGEPELHQRLKSISQDEIIRMPERPEQDVQLDGSRRTPNPRLYEGDILLSRQQLDSIVTRRVRRNAQKTSDYPDNLWTGGQVNYYFSPNFPRRRIPNVRAAMKFWENASCIRFTENKTASDRIKIINDVGCYSMVGKVGGEQVLSIGYGCTWIGTVAHELNHAFGIWHEQSRADRDDYVMINTKNILRRELHNFNRMSRYATDTYGVPYEFGSVMHYAYNDFGVNRDLPTLVTRDKYKQFQYSMSGELPSHYDIMIVNKYYKCFDKCPNYTNCRNGGYQDVNNCSKCRCPPGYSGDRCENIATNGCNRHYIVGRSPLSFNATAGWSGLNEIEYVDECTFHLTANKPGKKLEVVINAKDGFTSWNCYGSGVEVRNSNDPAMYGIRICSPDTKYTFKSEGGRIVLRLFARVNYSKFEFTTTLVD